MTSRILAQIAVIVALTFPSLVHGATAIEKYGACESKLAVPKLSGLSGSARVAEARQAGQGVKACAKSAGLTPARNLRPDFIALGKSMDSEDEVVSLAATAAEPSASANAPSSGSGGGGASSAR